MISITEQEFESLKVYLRDICGIDIPPEKSYLFSSRLGNYMKEKGYNSFHEFYEHLKKTRNVWEDRKIVELMTTNETSFFRDRHPFDTLRKRVLPEIAGINSWIPCKIKIWSAACSNGQEPYSIAMQVCDWLETQDVFKKTDFGIFATDISQKMLKEARAAVYGSKEVEKDVPEAIRKKYFVSKKEKWEISDEIKSMVRFAELNLASKFEYLGKFDIIFCRNVLIYFSEEYKRRIISSFYNMLNNNGILVIGASETLYRISDQFEPVHEKKRLPTTDLEKKVLIAGQNREGAVTI